MTVLVVSLLGALIGLSLGSRTDAEIGPFRAEISLAPSWPGETSVIIPPLGSLHLDSHDGPTHLVVRLDALDQARTQEMISDPSGISRATQTVAEDLADGVIRASFGSIGARYSAPCCSPRYCSGRRKVAGAGGWRWSWCRQHRGGWKHLRFTSVEEPRYEGCW